MLLHWCRNLCMACISLSYLAMYISYSPALCRSQFYFQKHNIRQSLQLYSSLSDSNPNSNPNISNETTDFDDISIDDIDMTERSVELTVMQMLNLNGTNPVYKSSKSPTETFKELYEAIKSKKNESNQLDAKKMLESLFEFDAKPIREPFDDKKVITKLREVLSTEDFSSLFKDPNIGDIY